MIYSALIHEVRGLPDARSPEEQEQALDLHRALQQDSKENGTFVAATQLAETGGTVVRHKKGKSLVTHGPYAESREIFVGFYLFEAKSRDEAVAFASRIPISELGRVEVRPVVYSESIGLTSG